MLTWQNEQEYVTTFAVTIIDNSRLLQQYKWNTVIILDNTIAAINYPSAIRMKQTGCLWAPPPSSS